MMCNYWLGYNKPDRFSCLACGDAYELKGGELVYISSRPPGVRIPASFASDL